MELQWLGIGAGVVLVLAVLVVTWRRRTADARASRRAHEAAREREPPVAIGETYELGVTEFTEHHSGDRVAVGRVQGFVVFTEDVPASVSVGDAIRVRVMSFNRGETSADATYLESV
jgi:predicted RNA-binding protein with TRAM domain